jgi:hypothetical protein
MPVLKLGNFSVSVGGDFPRIGGHGDGVFGVHQTGHVSRRLLHPAVAKSPATRRVQEAQTRRSATFFSSYDRGGGSSDCVQ